MNEIKLLTAAVDFLKDTYTVDHEYMETPDSKLLQDTINGLEKLIAVSYVESIRTFKNYLNDSMDYVNNNGAGSKEWIDWVSTPFEIKHGNMSVLIDNNADVFDSIVSLLDIELDYECEYDAE